MSSQLGKNNSELENPLKERIKLLMTDTELKHPYRFASRVGLSKGTFTGIWVDGRTTLQKKTIDKIADATNADPVWLMTGQGQPFKEKDNAVEQQKMKYIVEVERKIPSKNVEIDQAVSDSIYTAITQSDNTEKKELKNLLYICYEATEGALKATYTQMEPASKAEFLIKFMQALAKASKQYDEQTLLLSIFSIEYPLYNTRQYMSHENKVQLISDIYKQYDSNDEMKKATLAEYLKYKEDSNSGRSSAQ